MVDHWPSKEELLKAQVDENTRAMEQDQWQNCYDDGWQGSIVPEAFSHPAKFSRDLINRIYQHAKEMGWFKPGDYVLDPFGGVSLGALDALGMGLNWIGIELEEKFVTLGQQNIDLWNRQLKGWPNLGTARIVQGDSRFLRKVIKGATLPTIKEMSGLVKGMYEGKTLKEYLEVIKEDLLEDCSLIISSPPYAEARIGQESGQEQCGHHDAYSKKNGQLGAMPEGNFQDVIEKVDLVVSSPPFLSHSTTDTDFADKHHSDIKRKIDSPGAASLIKDYGHTPGNLANMKEGDIDLVVGSPPYAGQDLGGGEGQRKMSGSYSPEKNKATKEGKGLHGNYPKSAGQLGNLPEGSFDMCVSSPSYDEGLGHGMRKVRPIDVKKKIHMAGGVLSYGESDGQLAGASTFWQASKEIVQGCYELLKPKGMAIWVTKDYIKAKKRVPFSDRWLALCESVGFKLVCRHQAMLVKEHGTQVHIRGDQRLKTERKSFFRRNHETKKKAVEFWLTLREEDHSYYIEKATKLINPFLEKKILIKAQVLALQEMCLDDRGLDKLTRIDWEDILCMVKV